MQEDVDKADTLAAKFEQQLPAEGSSGRWCLGRARLVRIDRLVVRRRYRFGNIRISDRFAASKHALEAIARRIDPPQQGQIGSPASHHRLDPGDLQALA